MTGQQTAVLNTVLLKQPVVKVALYLIEQRLTKNIKMANYTETDGTSQTRADFKIECADNLAYMSQFPEGFFRLIATSPPYNIGKEYESCVDLSDYIESQEQVIARCVELLADNGSMCWQVGSYIESGEIIPLDTILYPVFKKLGLQLRNRIVWHFGHGLHCRKRLSGRYETINWWTKTDKYIWHLDPIRVPSKYPGKKHYKGPKAGQLSGNPLGKNPSDVWSFPNVKHNHPEKTSHPCQFPVELAERLVLSMTNTGDNVLDPYMGVGSTVIAAIKHSRAGYGCDLIEEYVDIARKRIDALLTGDLPMRPMGKPVHDPATDR